jgi:hypothetical protein
MAMNSHYSIHLPHLLDEKGSLASLSGRGLRLRHRHGAEIGQRLGFILDAIETLVMPADPRRAFVHGDRWGRDGGLWGP